MLFARDVESVNSLKLDLLRFSAYLVILLYIILSRDGFFFLLVNINLFRSIYLSAFCSAIAIESNLGSPRTFRVIEGRGHLPVAQPLLGSLSCQNGR